MANQRKKGNIAEEIAAKFMEGQGLQILHRNWQSGHKEIDMIGYQADKLVIVEVKARNEDTYEEPGEAISSNKIRNLISATEDYMHEFNIDREVRFDMVYIVYTGPEYRIDYYEDAFGPAIE
jgi:putative endonuclease